MAQYRVAPGGHLTNEDAQILGTTIETLTELHGSVRPHDIVEAARDATSPLHNYFEWDDRIAAEHYRLDQARYILRTIHVEIPEKESIRAFHSVQLQSTPVAEREFVSIRQVQSNEWYRQQIIDGALDELRLWSRRYHQYSELDRHVQTIDELLID